MLPSWIRSSRCRPRLTYFLATETTSRRLASTRSFLARSASASPWRITVRVCFRSGSVAPAICFALADFALQLAQAGLIGWRGCALRGCLISRSRWLISSTARSISRANSFHLMDGTGNGEWPAKSPPWRGSACRTAACGGFLLLTGAVSSFSSNLLQLLVQHDHDSAKQLGTSARVCRSCGLPSSTSPRSTTLSSSSRPSSTARRSRPLRAAPARSG